MATICVNVGSLVSVRTNEKFLSFGIVVEINWHDWIGVMWSDDTTIQEHHPADFVVNVFDVINYDIEMT